MNEHVENVKIKKKTERVAGNIHWALLDD